MKKGRYSGENDNSFSSILHRYAAVTALLGFNQKVQSDKIFDDSEKEKILTAEFSEQRELLLLMFADGVINRPAFDWFFDSQADFLDILISAEKKAEQMQEDESGEDVRVSSDNPRIAKALAIILFSMENKIFSDIDFDTAYEIAEYPDIEADFENCAIDYSVRLSSVLYRIGEPCVWFREGKFTNCDFKEYASEIEDGSKASPVFALNLSRLPFILRCMNKLYGVDFIRYASASSLILCRDIKKIDSEYEKYLAENKLKFRINAYIKRRKLCGNEVNCVDYCYFNIAGGKLVSSSLTPDKDLSAEEKKLPSNAVSRDPEHETDENELVLKMLREYASGFAKIPDETVIEVIHENNSYWYIFRDKSFSEIKSDFTKPAFDYTEVFGYVKMHSDNGNITRKNGSIEFKVNPTDKSSEYLGYAKNVLDDYLKRQAQTGQIARTLAERKKAAAEHAKQISVTPSGGNGANEHM